MIIIDRITRWQVDYWSSLYVGSLSFRRCIVIVNRMLHICWSLCYSDRRKTSRNTYLTFFVRNCEFGILDRQKNLVKFFILFLVIFSKTEKNFEKKILEHGYNSVVYKNVSVPNIYRYLYFMISVWRRWFLSQHEQSLWLFLLANFVAGKLSCSVWAKKLAGTTLTFKWVMYWNAFPIEKKKSKKQL